MTKQRPCDACGGTGNALSWYMDTPCFACSGRGWQSDAMPVAESWWAVDARDKVAQRVTADADTPPSEGGRFWKIAASSAAEAIDRALARRALCGR